MSAALVGRESELRTVSVLLDDLMLGRGGMLLITGEPGIGKTRLADALVAEGLARGARTAWATSWQDRSVPSLWLWSQVMDQLGCPPDVLAPASIGTLDQADAARFAQFDAVAGALSDAAETQPVVAVLDDLQWADPASLRMLEFLGGAVRARRLLLVTTCRDLEIAADDLAQLARLATTIALGGLDRAGVRQLLATIVDESVADEVADVVSDRSDGNPLFVSEFGQLLSATGRREVALAAVPPRTAAVIQRRLATLPESTVGILQVAAVLGKRFDSALVSALAGSEPDFSAAVAAGLVIRLGRTEHEFAHDLIRDVLIETTSTGRRQELHERTAAFVAAQVESDLAQHSIVAHHLEEAGDNEHAGQHWEAAGRWALGMLGYEQAADCFGRAADVARSDPEARADLRLAQADALLRAGDLPAARSAFDRAAEIALQLGDTDRLTTAVLGVGAGVAGWEVPVFDERHVRQVRRALDHVGSSDPRARSLLLARLSVAAATPETQSTARELAEESLRLAREVGDPMLEAQALTTLCDALAGPSHVALRLQHAEDIVRLAEAAGHPVLALLGRRFMIVALLELGEFGRLDAEIVAFDRAAGRLRQPLVSWYSPLFHAMRALLRGDTDEAATFVSAVETAAERTGSVNAAMLAATQRIGIGTARGQPIPPDVFEGIIEIDPAVWASYASAIAYLCTTVGDDVRARALLRMHADSRFERVGDDAEQLVSLMFFARVAVSLGDSQAQEVLYTRLAPHADLWGVDGIAAVCWGPVELSLSRLAAALGRAGSAREHLVRARTSIDAAKAEMFRADLELLEAALGSGSGPDLEPEASVVGPSGAATWRLDGDFWTLSYSGRTVRQKHSKGLADLAALLAAPGREVHVLDLWAQERRSGPVPRQLDLGEVLDARARASYRQRMHDLEDDIDEAMLDNDQGRLERARQEREFLTAELTAALGLGGRVRRTGDPTERARKAVTARIRLAIQRIARADPGLAAHLSNSVRTGAFCSYRPERAMRWQLDRSCDIATPDVAPPG